MLADHNSNPRPEEMQPGKLRSIWQSNREVSIQCFSKCGCTSKKEGLRDPSTFENTSLSPSMRLLLKLHTSFPIVTFLHRSFQLTMHRSISDGRTSSKRDFIFSVLHHGPPFRRCRQSSPSPPLLRLLPHSLADASSTQRTFQVQEH